MEAYLCIREIREEKEMTQTQLARKANISQSYLSELEHNKKSPTLKQVCKLAQALEVHPFEFIIFYNF